MNNTDLLNLIDITVIFEGFLALNKLNLNLKKLNNFLIKLFFYQSLSALSQSSLSSGFE